MLFHAEVFTFRQADDRPPDLGWRQSTLLLRQTRSVSERIQRRLMFVALGLSEYLLFADDLGHVRAAGLGLSFTGTVALAFALGRRAGPGPQDRSATSATTSHTPGLDPHDRLSDVPMTEPRRSP